MGDENRIGRAVRQKWRKGDTVMECEVLECILDETLLLTVLYTTEPKIKFKKDEEDVGFFLPELKKNTHIVSILA